MATVSNRKFAVVTGASKGIGLELARQCADHGFDLLVCADGPDIHDVKFGDARVETVMADLSTAAGCEELVQAVAGRPVDALLLNAGIGVNGEFVQTDLEEEIRSVRLNCEAVLRISKAIVPRMKARGEGKILITASIVSTAPSPFMAVYGATKAFDLQFAEALRVELADSGVTVTALQPGATDTNFFARADMEDTKVAQGKKDDPADVAKAGFEAMMAGKDSVVASSLKSKLIGLANEVLPETVKAKQMAKQNEPGSGKKA